MFEPFVRRPRVRVSGRDSAPVTVYGTSWCAQTMAVRRMLDRLGIPYTYHDIESDPAASRQVRWWTGGDASHPTIQIGGEVLVEPTTSELQWALTRNGLA
jgi:mycoredoxin